MYKSKVKETPGWNEEVLIWCMNAAKENGLKPGDYLGGFAIDEMKIQVITVLHCTITLYLVLNSKSR